MKSLSGGGSVGREPAVLKSVSAFGAAGCRKVLCGVEVGLLEVPSVHGNHIASQELVEIRKFAHPS